MTVETLVSKEQIAADSDGKLNEFLEYAEHIVAQFVTIVVEQNTAAEQAEEFNKHVCMAHASVTLDAYTWALVLENRRPLHTCAPLAFVPTTSANL